MALQIEYGYLNLNSVVKVDDHNIKFLLSIREGKEVLGDPKVGDLIPRSCEKCTVNEDHTRIMCNEIHELFPIYKILKVQSRVKQRNKRGRKPSNKSTNDSTISSESLKNFHQSKKG